MFRHRQLALFTLLTTCVLFTGFVHADRHRDGHHDVSCEDLAERARQACLATDRSEEECQAAHDSALAHGSRDDGDGGPRPGPEDCDEHCARLRNRVFEECVQRNDGAEHAEECEALASEAGARCLEFCGSDRPDPEPIDCDAMCQRRAAMLREGCVVMGGEEEACAAHIEQFIQHCRRGCDRPPPRPRTCEERCERRAKAVGRSCLEGGGTEEECEAEAVAALEECLPHCDEDPPSCEERCERRSEAVFAECISNGGSEDDCRATADGVLDACLTRCSDEPLPCDERCAQHVRELAARCEASDHTEEECTEIINRTMERCLARCNGEEPEPVPCPDRCANGAERLAAACAERGGNDEACAALVAEFTERCLAHCDDRAGDGDDGDGNDDGSNDDGDGDGDGDGGERGAKGLANQPSLSETLCEDVSLGLYADCMASGSSPADCESFRLNFLDICVVELEDTNDWLELQASAPPRPFLRGDANSDNLLDITDPVNTLFGPFAGTGPFPFNCIDRVDTNDDGVADITDALYTLEFLFLGSRIVAAPYPSVGHDPTFDQEVCLE